MESIILIRDEQEMPSSLLPENIVMNGLDYEIPLGGHVKSFTGTRSGKTLRSLKSFADQCDCVGALLSYDGEKYTIWNGDPEADDYWAPHDYNGSTMLEPSDQYGTVIAVCAGSGLWPVVGWKGTITDNITITLNGKSTTVKEGCMFFGNSGTNIYNTYISNTVRGLGWDNTKSIFTKFGSEIAGWDHTSLEDGIDITSGQFPTIWDELMRVDIEGVRPWQLDENGNISQVGDLFIPNVVELRTIWQNCFDNNNSETSGDIGDKVEDCPGIHYDHNIGRLLGLSDNGFWSYSQCPDSYNNAFIVGFDDGDVGISGKGSDCLSLACLHF